nr:hypothetical protein [Oscillochloris trichoides]
MIWTYRIVRDEIGRYSVREVYQEEDGVIITYSKTPVAPIGSSAEDLLHQIQQLRDAFELPILSTSELESVHASPKNEQSTGTNITLQQLKEELGAEKTCIEDSSDSW